MTDIEFLKTMRMICKIRCNGDNEKINENQLPECPFPWHFCDLDPCFDEMTDQELINICNKVHEYASIISKGVR